MEQAWIEYILNALWQLPLLAAGAWLLLRALKAEPLVHHAVWLAVLVMAVLLPLRGIHRTSRPSEPYAGVNLQLTVPLAAEPAVAGENDLSPTYSAMSDQAPVAAPWKFPTREQNVHLTPVVAHCIAGLFMALVAFGLIRIALNWRAAQQIVREAQPITLALPQLETLRNSGERLGVGLPQVRESSAISSPVLVGVLSPVLLLPMDFGRNTEDQIKAAFCHELAHLRRHDYLMNLICQFVALPVSWHPVTHFMQLRIRHTREMICDAIAAREMHSELYYAKCLVALAHTVLRAQTLVDTQAVGLFSKNTLEERVMQLMERKSVVSLRERLARVAGGATAVAAAIVISAVIHLTPVMAQSNEALPPQQAQVAPATPQVAPQIAPEKPSAAELHKSHRSSGKNAEPIVVANGDGYVLTPEAQARIDQQMADAVKQLDEAKMAIDSPEFKRQIEDATRHASEFAARSENLNKRMAELQSRLQSDEFKRQVEFARRTSQLAARNEELNKRMAELQARLQSDEFKRQIQVPDLAHNAEFQKQMAEVEKQLRSGELQKQMAEMQKQFASGELKQQMEKLQKQLQSGEFKKQMDKAMQELKEKQEQLDK